MEKIPLTRAYLETLSTSDLVSLADDNGIDIPEGLNRRFIIGELLELSDDNRRTETESPILVGSEYTATAEILPDTYNETQITVLLRDPGWVFVYWDFHATVLSSVTGHNRFETFFLRVNSLSDARPALVTDFFDIEVGPQDRKWYIHLSNRDYSCRIDLYARNSQEKDQLLAKSAELLIPYISAGDAVYDPQRINPPVLELSGIGDLQKNHFRNHRQSFN